MPTDSSTLSLPENAGSSPPKTSTTCGLARNACVANERTITPTRPAITASSRRKPRACSGEDREGDDARQHTGEEERDAEEQVEAERRADELGEVGRHGDRLGLDPETERDRAWKAVAAHLGQVLAGRDPELGAHRLDQHRHQVRGDDHPEQQVAELGAAGHVRREVAGVDVGDAGDERRPEEGPEAAHPAPLSRERLRCRAEHARLAGQDVFGLDDPRRVRLCVGLGDHVSARNLD